jgi:hypothetical protein
MTASNLLTHRKIVLLKGTLQFFAPAVILAGIAVASLPAHAAPAGAPTAEAVSSTRDKVSAAAAKAPETTGSVQPAANGDVACARSRKRLFVEGEGWIVRRVTTCY